MRDVFIPNKRGKNYGKRFGFVRFDCPLSADVAIEKANGSRFLENTIIVKRAAFNKNGLVNSVKVSEFPANNKNFQNSHTPGTRRVPAQEHSFLAGDLRLSQSEHNQGAFLSSANVVSGKKSLEPNRFIVKAQEEDIDWLERSIVARLHAHRDVESIREAFIAEGVWNIHIIEMGGNLVLLTFPSPHDMNCMLEGGDLSWLFNWFVDAKPWAPNHKVESSRVVWLNCYGIPVNLWNAETFFNIGKLWGEIITLNEATSKKTSFSVGKIKISTNAFEVINQSINLEHNGLVYPIRVVEEQVVVNNFMKAVCECHGCSFARVDYSLCSRDNVIRDGETIDDENVDSDIACIEEKTNLREHDEVPGSLCNDVSSNGESLSLLGSGGLDKQDMDGSNASNLGGDYSGRANSILASVEVAPDVSQSIISPFSHEQVVDLNGVCSTSVVNELKERSALPSRSKINSWSYSQIGKEVE